jgi:hypothetical protein
MSRLVDTIRYDTIDTYPPTTKEYRTQQSIIHHVEATLFVTDDALSSSSQLPPSTFPSIGNSFINNDIGFFHTIAETSRVSLLYLVVIAVSLLSSAIPIHKSRL